MATAGRGDCEEEVVMMPKGMLAREKWEPLGILNQERKDVMFVDGTHRQGLRRKWRRVDEDEEGDGEKKRKRCRRRRTRRERMGRSWKRRLTAPERNDKIVVTACTAD